MFVAGLPENSRRLLAREKRDCQETSRTTFSSASQQRSFATNTGKEAGHDTNHTPSDVAKMRTYDDTFSGQKIYPGKVRRTTTVIAMCRKRRAMGESAATIS